MVQLLDSTVHSHNEEEKPNNVRKFIKYVGVLNYLPLYARRGKEGESNSVVLEAMRGVYAQITATKHVQNFTFKNVLFSVVFANANTNQMHIAKTMGAFCHYIRKAIVKQMHVD
jgi:hypothetical protein